MLLCLPEWQLCEEQPKSACSSDFLSLLCWGPHPKPAAASRQSARGRGPSPRGLAFSVNLPLLSPGGSLAGSPLAVAASAALLNSPFPLLGGS